MIPKGIGKAPEELEQLPKQEMCQYQRDNHRMRTINQLGVLNSNKVKRLYLKIILNHKHQSNQQNYNRQKRRKKKILKMDQNSNQN